MGMARRRTLFGWVTLLICLLVIASATFVGAKHSAKDSEGDKDSSKGIESLLLQVLEENRALRSENALFRESQIDLLGQLNDMQAILRSFDERLSAFSDLDRSTQSKWRLRPGLSDAFKPAVAKPLLDLTPPRSVSTTRNLPSPRDSLAQGLDLAPSNPLDMPGSTGGHPRGMNQILITPQLLQGLLPMIPNLEAGYLYNFGRGVNSGRLTLDLLVPIGLSADSVVFGEVHNEWQDFWKTVTGGANHRIDLSIGGGYRTILTENTLVGVNGFYDTTRLGNRWYPSGSIGFEFAALLPGNDAIDLTFNWYGNMFRSNVLANAFRRGPSNYDFQAGYSHELWNGGPDLRLSATGYRFSAGTGVYGFRARAEARTRDGMFTLRYEAAHDRVNKTYHTIGGFLNVGLRMSNLLQGESPFEMPEPIFNSPRNLRTLLTRSASSTRNFSQPASVVVSRAAKEVPCDGDIVLLGPMTIPDSTWVPGAGQVPPLNAGTKVIISWTNIHPDTARNAVTFGLCVPSSGEWQTDPLISGMTLESGARTRGVTYQQVIMTNGIYYLEANGRALVIPTGGRLCFEFF